MAATPALAHLNPGDHGSFLAGLSHPVFGLDHVLAMVAVGVWAATLGGRVIWVLPSTFVCTMMFGFAGAVAGMPLPLVEPMVSASVFVLGLAVALTLRLPLSVAAGIVSVFGLFHGHAHGGELGEGSALTFGAGFAVSTAILHAFGVVLAVSIGRKAMGSRALQAVGWATALGGLWVASGT